MSIYQLISVCNISFSTLFNWTLKDRQTPSETMWNHVKACEPWSRRGNSEQLLRVAAQRRWQMSQVSGWDPQCLTTKTTMPQQSSMLHCTFHASMLQQSSALPCASALRTSWSSAFDLKFCSLRLPKIDQRFSMILRFQLVKRHSEHFHQWRGWNISFPGCLFVWCIAVRSHLSINFPWFKMQHRFDLEAPTGTLPCSISMHFVQTGWEGYHPWSRIQKVQHWAESTPELDMFLIDDFLLWHFAIPSFKHTLIVVQLWVSMLVFLAFLHHVDMLWWGQPDRNKPSRCEHRDCCLDCKL